MSQRRRRDNVRNAGDEQQVRRAGRAEAEYEEWFGEGLLATLGSPMGRRAIHCILDAAGIYESVWHEHGNRMSYNVGRQDFGHWLLDQCLEMSEDLTQTLEREARDWKRRTDKPRVEDEGDTRNDT